MDHVYYRCSRGTIDVSTFSRPNHTISKTCSGCKEDGRDCLYEALAICSVCGGSEGSLLPFCPERELTYEEDGANYAHYCAGTGPFAKATFEHLTDAKDACWERSYYKPTRGSYMLYHAVWQLWNHTEAGPL